jgi:hypothetical protein
MGMAKPSKQRYDGMYLCGASLTGGLKRLKKHLARGFGDTRKCMKTTTAIRVEMENYLNNHP